MACALIEMFSFYSLFLGNECVGGERVEVLRATAEDLGRDSVR